MTYSDSQYDWNFICSISMAHGMNDWSQPRIWYFHGSILFDEDVYAGVVVLLPNFKIVKDAGGEPTTQ